MTQTEVLAFRCDEAFRGRIRRHAERLQAQAPGGLKVAEADAVRDLVLRGLQAVETPKPKKRR
jgi:hypothetical protein